MIEKLKDTLAGIKELELKYDHQIKEYTSFKIGVRQISLLYQ